MSETTQKHLTEAVQEISYGGQSSDLFFNHRTGEFEVIRPNEQRPAEPPMTDMATGGFASGECI